jgi:hypothetical protein
VSLVQPVANAAAARIDRTAAAEIAEVIARHNPGTSRSIIASTGRLAAALATAAAALPLARQKKLLTGRPKADLARMVDALFELSEDGQAVIARADLPVEPRKGRGFGEVASIEEGRRRLEDYAVPMRIEEWAGPVAGPVELERDHGISRSTLHNWQRKGAVIGLLKGERKHVFPLQQFLDGRPVEGIARVTAIIRKPRVAWLWLVGANPVLGGRAPISVMRDGKVDTVIAAAEDYFAQP